ncbi:MAG: hypothetical protein WC876_04250 [Candidatus Thermoplasmatota archaeon]|jgi:hypothetical protein
MQNPFWTSGPVPPAYLDGLALPRPAAMATVLGALRRDGFAWLGGPPGSGRSTFLRQLAAELRRDALVVDGQALLHGDEEEYRTALAGPRREAASSWIELGRHLAPSAPLLAFDGAPAGSETWVRQATRDLRLPLVLVAPGGLALDSVGDVAAGLFLQRRARLARLAWAPSALAETVRLAAGDLESLQRLGAACSEAARSADVSTIGEAELAEGAVAVSSNLPGAAGRNLAGVHGARLRLLKAMVRDPDGSPTSWARRCHLEPKAAVVHLRRLCTEDGLVARLGRGLYRAAPLVALHLQARAQSPVQRIPSRALVRG